MAEYPKKSFLQSIHGKVLAAFLIGGAAVLLSWLVMQVGFQEMLQTVNKLSAPNEKLRLVNNLSFKIIQMEQLQRANIIQNPEKPSQAYHQQTTDFIAALDTLRQLSTSSPLQVQRIDSMELILRQHKELADQYFNLRADWSKNMALSKRVAYLSNIIASIKPVADSSVVTTSKKIITTTIVPTETEPDSLAEPPPKQSFFNRLFGSKKTEEKPRQLLRQIEEELNIQIDTLSVARQDSSIWEVEKVMRRIEKDYLQRRAHILDRELALVKSSSRLHTQMLHLLHSIEAEEIILGQLRNQNASEVVTASLGRMNIITIIFFLGAALFVLLIFLDISRSNKYRKALLLAKEEAEQLGLVKQRFLANMSHEIRTPLQSIIGFAEQVRQQPQPEKEAVEAIYRSSEHLLQIVNEVLDYSRIVAGKFTFDDKPFELQQLALEVIATLQPQATRKQLLLHLNYSCHNAQHVTGDPFRLRQILYNLLGNAIKFTGSGAVTLTVKCLGRGERPFYSFLVEDTGIGISEVDMQRIFNQFEQASAVSAEKYSGTGLGLSIVKELVERQGGYLTVNSKPGKGSAFEVQMPFKINPLVNSRPQSLAQKPAALFDGQVLVVDDDAFILELCSTILNKHSIQNTCTGCALSVATQQLPENLKVVFLDIRMPEISGTELCGILRQRLPGHVQIVALTAQALPEETAAILAHGFDGLLQKPFREEQLLTTLKRYAGACQVLPEPANEPGGSLFPELRAMTGDDDDLFKQVLEQFVAESRSDLELLALHLQQDAGSSALEIIHRLAGRTGQLGDRELALALQATEKQLIKGVPVTELANGIASLAAKTEILIVTAEQHVNAPAEA